MNDPTAAARKANATRKALALNLTTTEAGSFVADIEQIRRRARQQMENGAATDAYRGDRQTVIRVLNEALATAMVCVLRYKRHYYMALGVPAQAVAEEFVNHAQEQQEHADKISD